MTGPYDSLHLVFEVPLNVAISLSTDSTVRRWLIRRLPWARPSRLMAWSSDMDRVQWSTD